MGERSTQGGAGDNSSARARPGDDSRKGSAARLTPSQRDAVIEGLRLPARGVGATVVAADALASADLPIVIGGETVGGLRLSGLHGALDRLIDQIERELGQPVERLDREGKQAVVRRLDELGAFNLRKAVEDIADRLHVSRFTVYNYLNGQP
ncbi:MAG: helix-turn-helix domain-containing protein [Acidimicrobiales bacterium]